MANTSMPLEYVEIKTEADRQRATARLNAAAPEMLQLLRSAYTIIAAKVPDGENTPIACSIRELVAKVM